jgi:hypothetical protein
MARRRASSRLAVNKDRLRPGFVPGRVNLNAAVTCMMNKGRGGRRWRAAPPPARIPGASGTGGKIKGKPV